MNIFKKLFKKSSNNTLAIINVSKNIILPPESFYAQNKQIINKYYEEYKTLLHSRNIILSINLKKQEQIDYRIYIDILTSLEIHINDILNNPQINEYNYEYVTNILTRLKAYTHILKSIEEESLLRLKPLYKLKKNIIFNQNKKYAIDNEITRLEIQTYTIQRLIETIKLQIDACLKIIEIKNLKKDYNFSLKLSRKLIKYLLAYDYIEKSLDNIIYKQILLEKHLFKDKNSFNTLEKEYNELEKTNNLSRKDRIYKINKLIDKYMSIKDYKRITNEKLFKTLINYKINAYEIDYFKHQEILITKVFYPEETIIMEEIFLEKISNFTNSSEIMSKYKNYLTTLEYNKLARLIKNTIKINNEYNPKKVLASPELTAFLFSIDSPSKLINFFESSLMQKETINIYDFNHQNIFEFNDYVPIKTLMRYFYDMGNSQLINLFVKYEPDLYLLYQIYKHINDKMLPKIPNNYIYEGVEKITIDNKTIVKNNNVIEKYNNELRKGNKLVCPKSLKELHIMPNNNFNNKLGLISFDFELNDALESLVIIDEPIEKSLVTITFPPALKYFELTQNPQKIIMKDYLNSYLLNDPKKIKDFFQNLGNMQIYNKNNKIKSIIFQGKTNIDTFELDISKLDNKTTNQELIYKRFNSELKNIYEKLYVVAQKIKLNYSRKSPSIQNIQELESKLLNKSTKSSVLRRRLKNK